ncbi:MAG: ROK family protein [Acidobacteriota bacterium]
MGILCMESGGTKLVAALSEGGSLVQVLQSYRRPDQRATDTLDQLIEMGQKLTGLADSIQAVGFGFGGIVRRLDSRPFICFHELGWDEVDGLSYLQSAFQAPVFIENDCNLAGLGEAHFGAGKKTGSVFYATLGTGIGGAIIINGRLLQTGGLGEAEIGHLVVEETGPSCPCGNRGCLETLCSGPGLTRLAQEITGEAIDAPVLMENYRNHDKTATEVVETAARYLGRAFGSVINLLQPDVIVLGGGVMKSNMLFLSAIAAATQLYVFPLFRGRTRFALSRLEEHAVCQGAAVYARQQLERRRAQSMMQSSEKGREI